MEAPLRYLIAALVLLATPAYGQNASFGTVKQKKAEFTQQGAAPALSSASTCILYMDATTNALMASCNGGTFKMVIGSGGASNCVEDTSGNLTCNAFISPDADPTLPNRLQVIANTVDRTCANTGVAGKLTILDSLGTGNNWCFCNGTVQLFCVDGTAGIPDCQTGSDHRLNYTAATGVWSCNTN